MITKIKMFLISKWGLKYAPCMFPIKNYWIFIDSYQHIYKIQYTHDPNNPLTITVWEW